MKSLPILYQDEYLIAVNKPAGLLVHRSNIERHETEHAMKIVRDQMGRWVYPFHRLDRPTSGVLLFALDKETGRLMTECFSDGRIVKKYVAVVRGYADEEGRIDHPLREHWDRMTDQRADKEKPPKEAITEYKRLATCELPFAVGKQHATTRYSLVEARPLTGRTHQIRRHMKHIFHPIVGDTGYGDGKHNDFFRTQFNCHRLLLHARTLEFIHPHTSAQIRIEAPLDIAFNHLLGALGWADSIT